MDAFTLVAKLTLNKDEFTNGLKAVETQMNSDETKGAFSSWGVTVGNLASSAIKKALMGAVDFAKSVFTTGMGFEAMMDEVKSVTDPTEKQFEKLTQRAQELGATTKFTAEEAAEALYYMGIAGWDTEEMLSGVEGVLNLAAASGEDLGRVSDIVTDALTAMGLTAEDTGHFVNVLAAAATNSNTTVGMMGEAFKYLATTGGTLGYSIDDIAAALGLLANNGIKATQAGTSMRQILNTLIAPSDKAAEAMQALGLSLFEVGTDKRKPLMQVVQELRQIFADANFNLEGRPMEEAQADIDALNQWYDEEFKKLQDANASQKAFKNLAEDYNEEMRKIAHFNEDFLGKLSDIGGLRGISSLFALMNSTDEDVNQLINAIANSDEGKGTAARMAETMLDNLQGDVELLESATKGLKIALYGELNEGARQFVQTITDGVTKLTNFIQHGQLEWTAEDVQREAIGTAEANAAEAQGLVTYMDTLIGKYGEAASNTTEWVTAMERLNQLLPGINTAIKTEGESLSTTTQNFREYIEQHKQKAIEDAKRAYLGDLQTQYRESQTALGKAQVDQEIAFYTQQEAARAMAEVYFRNRQSAEARFGAGYREQTDEFAAYNTVEEIISALQEGKVGLDSFMAYLEASENEFDIQTLQDLRKTYEESQQTYEANAQQIVTLTTAAANLQTQLGVAEAAVARLAERVDSFDPSAGAYPQAKGDWFVPYDNYPSLLHRGEMVLTASQARQFRNGGAGNLDVSALTNAIVGAVQEGLRNAQVNAYMDGRKVTSEVSRIMNDQMMLAR